MISIDDIYEDAMVGGDCGGVGLTDTGVLGHCSHGSDGYMGDGCFHIPANALGGGVMKRHEMPSKKKKGHKNPYVSKMEMVEADKDSEFKKIDDIVAYLKDKKLKWTKVAKFQRINAVLSKGGEEVETIGSDGNKETKRKTKNGDWIVNNVSNPDNKWIIDDKTFKKKYEEHKDGVYKPKGGVMLAAKVSDCEEAGVEFAPPNWGGDVIKIQNDGYFMKDPSNDKDIYAISKKDYDATYKEANKINEAELNRPTIMSIHNLGEDNIADWLNLNFNVNVYEICAIAYFPVTKTFFIKFKDETGHCKFVNADFKNRRFFATDDKKIYDSTAIAIKYKDILRMSGNNQLNYGSANMKLWLVWGAL